MLRPALAILATLTACATDAGDADGGSGGGGKADDGTTSGDHQLPGFSETLLLAGEGGHLAIVHVGDELAVTAIAPPTALSPEVVHPHDGKFYALYGADLAVIDPVAGAIERTLALPGAPADVAWTDAALYVSQTAGAVAVLDPDTGAERATIDLGGLRNATGKVAARRMLVVGARLFVQVARATAAGKPERGALAVIDTATDTIERVIELEASGLTALNPDFALVHDPRRHHLFVASNGIRPSNTGMLARIDTESLAIVDGKRAESGFQGALVFGAPYDKLFMLYHTSTPTTSSHLFDFDVAADGAMREAHDSTLVDAFDGIDALAINSAGTLVAMANTCISGFCLGGAGINFIDARTSAVLPKLTKALIGFEPSTVEFLP